MRRKLIKAFFAVAFVALVAQAGVVLFMGNPWPAVAMPGFESVPDQGGELRVLEVDIVAHFTDGSTANVPRNDLLARAPLSHYNAIMNQNFRPLETRGGADNEDTHPEGKGESAYAPEAKQWMRQRLQTLYPGRSPARFEVAWTYGFYRVRDRKLRQVRVDSIGTLAVELR